MHGLWRFALAAAFGSLLSSAVLAADLGSGPRRANADPGPSESPFTWSGLYVGVHAGYGWSDITWQQTGADADHAGEGALVGGQIGYNWQVGRLVYGVEADITSSFIEGSNNNCCDHTINYLASVRGRLGYTAPDNRTLFYATAGAGWAEIEYNGFGNTTQTHFGYVVGGGIERAFTPHLTGRIEYLFYGFEDLETTAVGRGAAPANIEPTVQTVRFGLNYKF